MFFVSTAISCIGPFAGWFGFVIWYAIDAFNDPTDENGDPYEDELSYINWYIYVKIFLAFAIACINSFLTSEVIYPIYEWW